MDYHLFTCNINWRRVDTIVKQDPYWEHRLSGLITHAEKFEEKVNAAARNEVSNMTLRM